MRKEGKVIKLWWFNSRMIQLVKERNPEKAGSFKAAHRWFSAFSRRYGVALRRKTHTSQKAPQQLKNAITKFHPKNLAQEKKRKVRKK